LSFHPAPFGSHVGTDNSKLNTQNSTLCFC
jgi:hypothetical protein